MSSREPKRGEPTGPVGSGGGSLTPAVVGAVATVGQNLWSAHRADTAHQREVRDLQRAGLNPILSASGRGADVGQQESVAGSASAAARARAEIELMKSSADREAANAVLARTQAWELMSFAPGRGAEVQMRTAVAAMDEKQRREMLPLLLEKAQEEIRLTMASARASRARAALDEAMERGYLNQEEFERLVGEMGPAVRFFLEILRGVRR